MQHTQKVVHRRHMLISNQKIAILINLNVPRQKSIRY